MKFSRAYGRHISMLFLTEHEGNLSLLSWKWLFIRSQKLRKLIKDSYSKL